MGPILGLASDKRCLDRGPRTPISLFQPNKPDLKMEAKKWARWLTYSLFAADDAHCCTFEPTRQNLTHLFEFTFM